MEALYIRTLEQTLTSSGRNVVVTNCVLAAACFLIMEPTAARYCVWIREGGPRELNSHLLCVYIHGDAKREHAKRAGSQFSFRDAVQG